MRADALVEENVVIADAKILILKQITTAPGMNQARRSCYCRCKDTNFKANHNHQVYQHSCCKVVIADAKILILKQITTGVESDSRARALLLQMQRY